MGKVEKSPIQNPNYQTTGDVLPEAGRGRGQDGWYVFASKFCKGQSVLDVGCGLGYGLEILSKEAKSVYGLELDERLRRHNIFIKSISEVETKSVDTVTAIDVIEHVENDIDFVNNLERVARHQIIITTPNFTAGRCKWPYHIREYMPHQLIEKFANKGKLCLYKGTPSGDNVFEIKYLKTYFILNKLRVYPLSSFFTRVINKFIPTNCKIHSHLCVRIVIN